MSIIKQIYRKIFPEKMRKKIALLMKKIVPKDFQEQRRRFGRNNPDKTFYIIRTATSSEGWGYYRVWLFVLANIKYAVNHGWIPIVDFKNYKMGTLLYEKKYDRNAWEIYNQQPIPRYSLDEVYSSKNVVLSEMNIEPEGLQLESWYWYKSKNAIEIEMWKSLADQYMTLNKNIQEEINVFYDEKMKNRRILGVAVRMDYLRGALMGEKRYNGHPVQAPINTILDTVHDLINNWNLDTVFLAIDDRESLDFLSERIETDCIYLDRRLFRLFKDGKPVDFDQEREFIFGEFGVDSEGHIIDPVSKNIEYIVEMNLLSKCTCLYAGMSAGVQAACIMNGNQYEHVEIMEYEATVC